MHNFTCETAKILDLKCCNTKCFTVNSSVGYFIIYRSGDHVKCKLKYVPEANKIISLSYVN